MAEAARLLRASHPADAGGRRGGHGRHVSHLDVLKIFLRADKEIGREIMDQVIVEACFRTTSTSRSASATGSCCWRVIMRAAHAHPPPTRAVAGVEGVVRVENRLGCVDDQSSLPHTGRPPATRGARR